MNDRIKKLRGSLFLKNLILALCAIIVFLFSIKIFLGVYTRHNKYKEVPDFSYMTIEEARKSARQNSLRIEINDSLYVPAYQGGTVLTQMPEAGAKVKSGRRIFLTVNSYRQRMVTIPYVSGVSLRQAKNDLEVAGLEIGKLEYKNDIATNYVLETRFDGQLISSRSNLQAEQGSGVTLVVGMTESNRTTTIPKVVGFPEKEAKSRLWEAGLNVGNVKFDEGIGYLNRSEARVYSQKPEQGSRVPLGTEIVISLALDEEKVEQGSTTSDKEAKRIASREEEARRKEMEQNSQEEADTDSNNPE